MELLNNDMVYCPVPLSPSSAQAGPTSANSEELLSGSPEEVFLGNGDARYYNLTAAMTIPLPGSNGSGRRRHSIGTFLNKDRANSGSIAKASTAKSVPITPETETAPSHIGLQKISSPSIGTKMQDVVTSPTSVGTPEWRHPASLDIPRSTHSRRKCNRCSNTKGKLASILFWFILLCMCVCFQLRSDMFKNGSKKCRTRNEFKLRTSFAKI